MSLRYTSWPELFLFIQASWKSRFPIATLILRTWQEDFEWYLFVIIDLCGGNLRIKLCGFSVIFGGFLVHRFFKDHSDYLNVQTSPWFHICHECQIKTLAAIIVKLYFSFSVLEHGGHHTHTIKYQLPMMPQRNLLKDTLTHKYVKLAQSCIDGCKGCSLSLVNVLTLSDNFESTHHYVFWFSVAWTFSFW